MTVRPASVDVDLRTIRLSPAAIAALARVYARWEGGRGLASVVELEGVPEQAGHGVEEGKKAVEALFDAGLIQLASKQSERVCEVEIRPLGIAWSKQAATIGEAATSTTSSRGSAPSAASSSIPVAPSPAACLTLSCQPPPSVALPLPPS